MESRVKAPAVALALAAGASLALALLHLAYSILVWLEPQAFAIDFGALDIHERDVRELLERAREELQGPVGMFLAVAQLLVGIFVLVAALQMARLRSWGLALAASLLAAVPCILPCTCCCLNLPIAVWCVFVLLQADVRSAFQARASTPA
jgi:hypothetical protein